MSCGECEGGAITVSVRVGLVEIQRGGGRVWHAIVIS